MFTRQSTLFETSQSDPSTSSAEDKDEEPSGLIMAPFFEPILPYNDFPGAQGGTIRIHNETVCSGLPTFSTFDNQLTPFLVRSSRDHYGSGWGSARNR
jgi:hypothetical protein